MEVDEESDKKTTTSSPTGWLHTCLKYELTADEMYHNLSGDGSLFSFSMAKIIRCAGNDDIITIKTSDAGDTVTFVFESPSKYGSLNVVQKSS